MTDLRTAGFKERTRVADARESLLDVPPIDRTERLSLSVADGRVIAEPVDALRDVPHYARAAMDGWAVRAEDTFGASGRSPAIVRPDETIGPGRAVRVHTGSELPDGADAVVMIEETERVGDELEVFDAVGEGENVAPVGEDVEAGQRLYEPGHLLRPSDLGLLKGTGIDTVEVAALPEVAVIPTGEELVQADPDPGEVVETNRFTISRLAERWGADVTRRGIVTDDRDALRAAIQRDLVRDVVVTTGGSSVGERDLIPEVVEDLGEVFVHGVALKPGHPVALGRVEGITVVMLPGYPVAAIINAVQFLRPLIKHLGGTDPEPLPTREATLARKIRSEPGVRTFVRVTLEAGDDADGTRFKATPTRASGSGVLSSVALADGWVVVEESREGIPAGETVAVENWEYNG
ncbi:molybdopterin molybdotransferase MoeA [Natronomonas salsuginis]|jgi:molybdopterin molybdotransferase|uniref:Molybdopterin molybdotransferase MoeA n=1 Tax=Natronomonas salsuginis TaxID=2217661 RepID=A0A4U5JQ06_9EURY|nr:gephyrin-like molybdotransferase Glp [Natronomonas salsuginis]TKR28309.1 molybdopterin molybdotransferase MoeA [Natronomonas salsuginis]